ncbi:MAG: hypothetical protein KDA22_15785 [Phycisphaerales bacterium]|nr:hypothetical protein [Phycisphaerales bacterium]
MPASSPTRSDNRQRPDWRAVPEVRYPQGYLWFVFVSSLDIMLTWAILNRGGEEVNPVAKLVIDHWDLPGAIAFKFSLVLFVIVACEIAGRHAHRLALALIGTAVAVSAIPVVWSLALLVVHTFGRE